jgi:23S rRNA (cytidine1920-2'-O)/16S rRNA (cytidine1409-2'-O)-methyltransferase
MTARRRLDAEMVRRGLVPSRERARLEIDAGRVTVGGAPVDKPARLVAPGEPILVHGPGPRYVSRAGEKLAAAIDEFGLVPVFAGARVLDAGASTGGFTDCALQHGAREVVAVDVGHNQLHEKLRDDPRVRDLERTNLRHLEPGTVGEPADVLVADLSFISLRLVLAPVFAVLRSAAPYAVLVKPQFEAGRAEANRGRGVIADPEVWRRVLGEVADALVSLGATIMGAMVSPLTGADGNVEFVVVGRAPGTGADASLTGRAPLDATARAERFDAVVDQAVASHLVGRA